MYLKKLGLLNFRNYSNLDLNLDQTPVVLVGNNAAGKSNLLEAVYFLATTKSFKADSDSELIKQIEVVNRVWGEVVNTEKAEAEVSDELEVTLQLQEGNLSKRVRINKVPKRVVDYIGSLPAVLFSPTDINMVIGSPSLRRWHLDLALAQVDKQYKRALTIYEQVLYSRNKVLKRIREGQGRLDELDFWTDELIKYSETIIAGRKAFLEAMDNFRSPLGVFQFVYKQHVLSKERLKSSQAREIAAATTLIGPHRDDFEVLIEGRNLTHFGSRGEQRTATLTFKLAQLEYMALILGKRPILLLDDVFSELDATHRSHVVEIVSRQQTIMATVELENIPQSFLKSARILRVESGEVRQ